VNAAIGAGLILPTGLSGITCDVNSSADTTVPADTSLDPSDWNLPDSDDFESVIDEVEPIDTSGDESELPQGWTSNSGIGGSGEFENPEDGLDRQEDPFDNWPPQYVKPGDAGWPEDWPYEPANDPDDPNQAPYVPLLPVPSNWGDWPIGDEYEYRTVFTFTSTSTQSPGCNQVFTSSGSAQTAWMPSPSAGLYQRQWGSPICASGNFCSYRAVSLHGLNGVAGGGISISQGGSGVICAGLINVEVTSTAQWRIKP
jgi:hypothetical protein